MTHRHLERLPVVVTIAATLAGALCRCAFALPVVTGDLLHKPPFTVRMIAVRSGKTLQTSRVWVEPSERNGEPLILIRGQARLEGGVTRETRTLLRPARTLRCLTEEHRVFTAAGETLSENMRQFRPDALPFTGLEIPDDTYPLNEGMLYLLAALPFDADGNGSFHVLGLVEAFKLDVWRHGTEEVTVPAGRFRCDHLRMRPNVESLKLPLVLRPLAPLFLPEFEAWIDRAPPHLAVRVKGPFGPSGDRDVMLEIIEIGTQVTTASPYAADDANHSR